MYLIGCTWLVVVSTLVGLLVLSPLRCVVLVRRAPAVVVIATGLNTQFQKWFKNRLFRNNGNKPVLLASFCY